MYESYSFNCCEQKKKGWGLKKCKENKRKVEKITKKKIFLNWCKVLTKEEKKVT